MYIIESPVKVLFILVLWQYDLHLPGPFGAKNVLFLP